MRLRRQVRWMCTLPVVMLLVTVVLMFLASGQELKAPHASDTPFAFQPPARLFAELINGPGFYLTFLVPGLTLFGRHLYDFGRLLGVIIFWTWIGWGLDGRFRGTRKALIRVRWVRAGVHAMFLSSCVLLIWGTLSNLHSLRLLPSHLLWRELLITGLWHAVLARYAAMAWLLLGAIYFCTQFLAALRHRTKP
jgi:hypothetical protein